MSTNHTPNYSLSQWQASDQVLRTDFNEDNAKIDAVLRGFEARMALMERAMTGVTFSLGQFALVDMLSRRKYLSPKAMIYEAFLYPDGLKLSGGAAIQNNILTLSGTGAQGSLTDKRSSTGMSGWSRAWLWVHHSRGSVVPKINGTPAQEVNSFYDLPVTTSVSSCHQYTWEGQGSSALTFTLDLNCGSDASMEVFDYMIFFC